MKVGEKARYIFRPEYAYGNTKPHPFIPENATIKYQIELLEIKEWKKKINEAIPQDMYKDYIVEEAVIAFRSIAKTLFDVHELGYTHRDVKPKNLYRLGDEFLIGDFGIVDIPDSDHKTKKVLFKFEFEPESPNISLSEFSSSIFILAKLPLISFLLIDIFALFFIFLTL